MGCKAEGAAQGFTVLGGIVLVVIAIQMINSGINALGGDGLIDVIVGIVLILMVALSYDACGLILWKMRRNGAYLTVFGLFSIFIVLRHFSFEPILWLMNSGTLAGFMILIAGMLLLIRS
ncbi:MAG: hypothetical protein ACFFEX_06560 [Candidatus Thorarchaeota archaeon]